MAGSVNKVILVGNLGADPEVRHTQDGRPIANLRVATSDSWRDTKARAGWYIWIPSEQFALTLQGKVKGGSITSAVFGWAEGVIEKIENFAVGGAAFVAGLLKGAWDSIGSTLAGTMTLTKGRFPGGDRRTERDADRPVFE